MSAKDQIAAMLNELMGPSRNAENLDLNFRDSSVCKFFLAGFCPHDEFVNTKADLGTCRKIHDENLRIAYRKSEYFEKLGYERQFYRYLQRIQDDMRKKIDRNKERLALTQGSQNLDETTKKTIEEKIERLEKEMAEYVEVAEKAGLRGDLDKSQKYVKKAEEVNMELDSARNLLNPPPPEYTAGYKDPNAPKPMRICEVCGSFLIIGDSQQRVEDHMTGRQHMGFAKIMSTLQEIEEKVRDISPEQSATCSRSRSSDRREHGKSHRSESSHKSSNGRNEDRHRSKRSRSREHRRHTRSRSPHHNHQRHKGGHRR